jgi:hypothetical protein
MKRFSLAILTTVAIAIYVNCAFARQIRHTLRGLVETSPLITLGKVSTVSSIIEKEEGREVIYTYVTIEIESILKGELRKPELKVKMLGGNVGDRGGWSEKYVAFRNNEEVLLFLNTKDEENNVWEMQSTSAKLPIVNINGLMQFDCSLLCADEVSQYDSNPYVPKDTMIKRITDYIAAKEGGS